MPKPCKKFFHRPKINFESTQAEVKKLSAAGKIMNEILKKLKHPKISKRFIQRTVQRFNETKVNYNHKRIGHPQTPRTARMIKLLRCRIHWNP